MNKDVVYIEPEDDITDIIARVKNAKEKLVALVPPKKIGVLRSAVNTKLIAKAGKSADKVIVIVTTDPALMKLAAAAQIPVAKTLQSRPKLPSEIIEETVEPGEQVIDEKDFSDEAKGNTADTNSSNTTSTAKVVKSASSEKPDQSFSSDDIEKDSKKPKDDKANKKGLIPTLEKYRKWVIIGGVAFVGLVVFLIWAFVFAPAVDIDVAIRTTANNFSEEVSFVTEKGKENVAGGTFLLEEKKVEKSSSQEFTATGQKDIGEKASGNLKITAHITSKDGLTVPSGSTFTTGGLSFTGNKEVVFTVSEADGAKCLANILLGKGCDMDATMPVTANEPGDKYNIPANSSWISSVANVTAKNEAALSGGTTNIVTVVSQQDYDNAKNKLENAGREDGKTELLKEFGDDMTIIESSLEISTSDPKSTPGVGEEVKSGVTPKIEATTTYKMFAVNKTTISDYVKSKAEKTLASDQKIYAVDTPFFENFSKKDDKITAKLKTSTQTGPKVNEEDIMEKSKGKKIGEVKSILKSISGVSSVSIKPSFPWVGSVPDDPNKISIELKVEE
ncbi:hypothetical protein IJG79_01485 [Candidatus Saccharibacteria bacterium]|nr:hypothetical protein [Candidatus Saccharibacteria bacterium]